VFNGLPPRKIHEMRDRVRKKVILQMEDTNKKSLAIHLKKITKFDSNEIEAFYTLFLLNISPESETFRISIEGFSNIFARIFPWWKGRADIMELTFKMLDERHLGLLRFHDLVKGLNPIFKGTLEDRLKFCFEMHDFNKEGSIQKGSLYNVLDALMRIYIPQRTDRGIHVQYGPKGGKREVSLDTLVSFIFDKLDQLQGNNNTNNTNTNTNTNTANNTNNTNTNTTNNDNNNDNNDKKKEEKRGVSFEEIKEILLNTPMLNEFISLNSKQHFERKEKRNRKKKKKEGSSIGESIGNAISSNKDVEDKSQQTVDSDDDDDDENSDDEWQDFEGFGKDGWLVTVDNSHYLSISTV